MQSATSLLIEMLARGEHLLDPPIRFINIHDSIAFDMASAWFS